jgi:hypothetical protein
MSVVVFWIVISCGLVGGYEISAGTYHLCLQGFSVFGNHLQDVTIQKVTIDISTAISYRTTQHLPDENPFFFFFL